jgi:hypothetical protein
MDEDHDDEDDEGDDEATGGESATGGYQWKPVYVCTEMSAGHLSRSRTLPTPAPAKRVKVADLSDTEREEAARVLRATK